MKEGYDVEVCEYGDGRWIAAWESYEEKSPDVPKHEGFLFAASPSEALRDVATAIHDLRMNFHD